MTAPAHALTLRGGASRIYFVVEDDLGFDSDLDLDSEADVVGLSLVDPVAFDSALRSADEPSSGLGLRA